MPRGKEKMLKHRKHARYLKTLSPYDRILGHVMVRRSDAQVFYSDDIDCAPLDAYIQKKKAEGIDISYLDIFAAATVRLYAKRPALNRFIMGGRVFANDRIYMSMAVKKSLREHSGSTTIKIPFTGHETIFEVKEKFDALIHDNKEAETVNSVDKTAKLLTSVPNWLMRLATNVIRVLDRWSLLPTKLVELSPFHCSVFITYLKSLGIPGIYHHIYDLGTTSQFVAVGKEQKKPVIDRVTGQVVPGKVLTVMIVADERVCDGLYYARSFRLFRKIIEDPAQLEIPLETVEQDID